MAYFRKAFLVTLLFIWTQIIFADAFNYMHIQRLLKENRDFLEFINAPVSNFGKEDHKKFLHRASYHQFLAQKYFLASHYKDAFVEIRRSQKIQTILFDQILADVYQADTRRILELSAGAVIQSQDARALSFLKLGFRDLRVSEENHSLGKNIGFHLYSSKIKYYIEGIKFARQAKKLAFLSLMEMNTPAAEKSQNKKQTLDDYLFPKEKEVIGEYQKNKDRLTNMIQFKLIQDHYNYLLHHDDNFSLIPGKNLLYAYENEHAGKFSELAIKTKRKASAPESPASSP